MSFSKSDHIRGCLYGQAIGDALGVSVEFQSKLVATLKIPQEGHLMYLQPWIPSFRPGQWTDDTDQALCILRAYLDVDTDLNRLPKALAYHLIQWAKTNPPDIGTHTRQVFRHHQSFLEDPIKVSKAVWEKSGGNSAPNGAVMRTAIIGTFHPEDMDWTERAAVLAAETTHFDPRCVASCVAISCTVAGLLQQKTIPAAFAEGIARAGAYHPNVSNHANKTLDGLALGGPQAGYTYRCMGVGLWALGEFAQREESWEDRFEDILRMVISEGGDADTNGAVAGAVLGSVVGYSHLPKHLVRGLQDKDLLEELLCQMKGMQDA